MQQGLQSETGVMSIIGINLTFMLPHLLDE